MKNFIKVIGAIAGVLLLLKAVQTAVDYFLSNYSSRYVCSEVDGLNDYHAQD